MKELTANILSEVITKRPEDSHKGTFGRAVLVGGNEQYGGAIIMSAEGCLKAGAGLTTVITHYKNHAPLHTRLPEAMVVGFKDEELIETSLALADIVLIGPGLGLDSTSLALLKQVIKTQSETQWLVIDGSAITLFAKEQLRLNYPQRVVFTPHQMEWQRLSGIPIKEQSVEQNLIAQQKLQANIVLKSHRTELYFPNQLVVKNPTGNAAMASGGMGDTLAGIITGFLAQFTKEPKTIAAATYLHSLIGDDLAQKSYVVLPTEISRHLPYYMKKYS